MTSQSPGLPGILATAYNPGMCLLTLPVIYIVLFGSGEMYGAGVQAKRQLLCEPDLPVIIN